jgi:hypothetical protein
MRFTHFDPRRATFCVLQIQESDSYTVKRDGSALVLAASPQDPLRRSRPDPRRRWTSGG